MGNREARWIAVVGLSAALSAGSVEVAGTAEQAAQCTPAGSLTRLPGLPEASGLAVSQRAAGRLWTHNDSGDPVLFALDGRGSVTGQVRVDGAAPGDWEAIATGPCEEGSCLYVADIGDNEAERERISIYRILEPEGSSGTARVGAVFHATYPDGAHDAETLLATSNGLYVVTKGRTGDVAIYRFPSPLRSGSTVTLERVGEMAGRPSADSWITDGSVSPDGRWVVLRSNSNVTFYRADDLLKGRWRAAATIDLTPLKEPQGEGIAFGSDNTLYVVGEGGGKGRPGTFARFTCAPPLD